MNSIRRFKNHEKSFSNTILLTRVCSMFGLVTDLVQPLCCLLQLMADRFVVPASKRLCMISTESTDKWCVIFVYTPLRAKCLRVWTHYCNDPLLAVCALVFGRVGCCGDDDTTRRLFIFHCAVYINSVIFYSFSNDVLKCASTRTVNCEVVKPNLVVFFYFHIG